MTTPSPLIALDPGLLRLGADLRRAGIEPARAPDDWHHVRHGVWMPSAHWVGLTPDQQHAALVHAADLVRRPDRPRVVAAWSAAALWGMPRIEDWPDCVGVLSHSRRASRSGGTCPVVGPGTEPVAMQGLEVTPPARTVVDLARTGSLVSAVAAADHALRRGLCTAAELTAAVEDLPPRVAGRRLAALVRDLADPGSMSAGESLSRVQMYLLGLPRPRLQVAHTDDQGLIGYTDFGWSGVVGEFDGRVKYRIPEGADAEEAGRVLWAEKKREDRLRRQVRVARWVWSVALDRPALGRLLAGVGIRPERRSTWFDLGGPTI
ncbi:hypothetical protein [Arthrobacter sp. NEB 688]|uniref:hypothetical protein n=1 Tax=Arthrobacter sp. NEB 688 TaxID=904039 RepID=UPI00156507CA|nr:hypothetical protein [Arthrobacter sp. NEB 688]QKE85356.1 hypothetical protein HL663_16355 [Arthrobacter sp. NEB 688]